MITLNPEALKSAEHWLSYYEKFWSSRMDVRRPGGGWIESVVILIGYEFRFSSNESPPWTGTECGYVCVR